jgi:small-conductance mechanosensitive channel
MRFADALIDAGRTEMNELKTLEDRLKLATDRISAALSVQDSQNNGLTEAQEANAALRAQLAELRQEREGDLVEVNNLIEQIRPLMEGNDNA